MVAIASLRATTIANILLARLSTAAVPNVQVTNAPSTDCLGYQALLWNINPAFTGSALDNSFADNAVYANASSLNTVRFSSFLSQHRPPVLGSLPPSLPSTAYPCLQLVDRSVSPVDRTQNRWSTCASRPAAKAPCTCRPSPRRPTLSGPW